MTIVTSRALKSKNDFNRDGLRAQELAGAIQSVRQSLAGGAAPAMVMKETAGANAWAAERAEIRRACSRWTDEEISLYECMALTGWESR